MNRNKNFRFSEKRLVEVRNTSPFFARKKGVGRGRRVLRGEGGILVFNGNREGISRRRRSLKVGLKKIDQFDLL